VFSFACWGGSFFLAGVIVLSTPADAWSTGKPEANSDGLKGLALLEAMGP
jgi:hypothetical protein